MKAMTFRRYGGPEVLGVEDLPIPEPGPNEVRVRMVATSVNAGDWHLLRGDPWLVRLMFGLTKPRQPVLGWDIAGIVDEVGSEVTAFKPGDRVFGSTTRGAFAEYSVTSSDQLVLLPDDVSFEDAAVTPSAGFTAWQGLCDHGKVQPGQEILVHGASGGVGMFCVLMGKAFGARVTAVCSGSKAEMVRGLGADEVIDYEREDIWTSGRTFDVVIDTALFGRIAGKRRSLRENGRYVIIGGDHFIRNMLFAAATNPFSNRRIVNFVAQPNQADLVAMCDLLEAGRMKPVIDREFPLEGVPDAIRHMESRAVQGKILIRVESG